MENVLPGGSVWQKCTGSMKTSMMVLLTLTITLINAEKIPLPRFEDLRAHYPGYFHHGGTYRNHELLHMIGVKQDNNLLLHDTSALRLSYSLNKIGGAHSLGQEMIRLSRFGHDSVEGSNQLQYIFLPISFGPYLADKYGYPNISKLHQEDPVQTKHTFWGKQGILRVITYTIHGNQPKGHVALWDCYHFHQSRDIIAEHKLLTVEFWESPDSSCSQEVHATTLPFTAIPNSPLKNIPSETSIHNDESKSNFGSSSEEPSNSLKAKHLKHIIVPSNARHSAKKMHLMQNN